MRGLTRKLPDETGKNLEGLLLAFFLIVKVDIGYAVVCFSCLVLKVVDYKRAAKETISYLSVGLECASEG